MYTPRGRGESMGQPSRGGLAGRVNVVIVDGIIHENP